MLREKENDDANLLTGFEKVTKCSQPFFRVSVDRKKSFNKIGQKNNENK